MMKGSNRDIEPRSSENVKIDTKMRNLQTITQKYYSNNDNKVASKHDSGNAV